VSEAGPSAVLPPSFAVVVAADSEGGIGKDGKLPWRLARELAFFKQLTSEAPPGLQNAVIMGRKTFDSIAPKFRPLRGRINVVLSRDAAYRPEGALAATSLEAALTALAHRPELASVFVIGGGELYRTALRDARCARVHLTRVHAKFDCDTYLPSLGEHFTRVASDGPQQEDAISYTFETYDRLSDA
jgi:dihydrofolate reductase